MLIVNGIWNRVMFDFRKEICTNVRLKAFVNVLLFQNQYHSTLKYMAVLYVAYNYISSARWIKIDLSIILKMKTYVTFGASLCYVVRKLK